MEKDEILKKLSSKLMKEDYQRVLKILKEANSVVGDELENLLDQLQVNPAHPIKLASLNTELLLFSNRKQRNRQSWLPNI
jgi:hypothetical protein